MSLQRKIRLPIFLFFCGSLAASTTYPATALTVDNCPFQIYSGPEYPPYPTTYDGSFGAISNPSTELAIRYYGAGSTQSIVAQSTGGLPPAQWALYADGVQVGAATGTFNGPQFQTFAVSGLDANQHLFEWWAYGIQSGIQAVVSVTSSGTIRRNPPPPRTCVGVYGDSIVDLRSSGATDSRLTWSPAMRINGFDIMRAGAAGQPVSGVLEKNTWAITGAHPLAPSIVITEGGSNDQRLGISVPTFQAAVLNELTQLATGMPKGGKILRQQIPPNAQANSSQRPAYNAAIVAAVNAYNAANPRIPACTYSVDSYGISPVPGVDTVDGSHLIAQNPPTPGHPFGWPLKGYGKLTNALSLILAGYGPAASSVLLSGPSSGTAGVSSTFTVAAAAAGAVFSAGETFTISDGGFGGSFTDSTGEAGTGSMTIHPPYGSTSIQVGYTSSSEGTRPLSISGLPNCYTAPAPHSFTIGAATNRRP